jgi:hypothetical protein
MGLVENEDLVSVSGWSKDGSLAQISGIVNPVVARGINFNYI